MEGKEEEHEQGKETIIAWIQDPLKGHDLGLGHFQTFQKFICKFPARW